MVADTSGQDDSPESAELREALRIATKRKEEAEQLLMLGTMERCALVFYPMFFSWVGGHIRPKNLFASIFWRYSTRCGYALSCSHASLCGPSVCCTDRQSMQEALAEAQAELNELQSDVRAGKRRSEGLEKLFAIFDVKVKHTALFLFPFFPWH